VTPGQRCCERVYSSSYPGHTCGNPAKMEHEGKPYCGIHDPVKRAAREAASKAKWDALWKAKTERWAEEKKLEERRTACELACQGVETHDLAPGILLRYMRGI